MARRAGKNKSVKHKKYSTCTNRGCLLPSSAPKAASIPNIAALELMSSGRSPEKDMMSAQADINTSAHWANTLGRSWEHQCASPDGSSVDGTLISSTGACPHLKHPGPAVSWPLPELMGPCCQAALRAYPCQARCSPLSPRRTPAMYRYSQLSGRSLEPHIMLSGIKPCGERAFRTAYRVVNERSECRSWPIHKANIICTADKHLLHP